MSSIDDVVVETIGIALRTGDLAAEFPRPDDPVALTALDAPSLAVTAERDSFFPGTRTCERVARTLSSLDECVLLTGERHFLSPASQDSATERIRTFLVEHTVSSR